MPSDCQSVNDHNSLSETNRKYVGGLFSHMDSMDRRSGGRQKADGLDSAGGQLENSRPRQHLRTCMRTGSERIVTSSNFSCKTIGNVQLLFQVDKLLATIYCS